MYTRAAVSAARLLGFLDSLFASPEKIAKWSLGPLLAKKRPLLCTYDRVTIVAHSLGAIVTRLALIEARESRRTWLPRTDLVLFAPAHRGADIVSLAQQGLTGLTWGMSLFTSAVKYRAQALLDLEPQCQTLQDIESRTQNALTSGNNDGLVARKVLHAESDKVVSPNKFCQDQGTVVLTGRSHTDVCKPTAAYLQPVNHLLEVL